MGCDVVSRIASDLVLRFIDTRMMRIALVLKVGVMHLDDLTAYMSCLGAPLYMATQFELAVHGRIEIGSPFATLS